MTAATGNASITTRGRKPETYWRPLAYFAAYRLVVCATLLLAVLYFGSALVFGLYDLRLFATTSACYFAVGILLCVAVRMRKPAFQVQVSLQVGVDVLFLVLLMHASGGISSGLGLLLLPALAAASLVSRGRLALFHAALASIAVLLEHAYQVLKLDSSTTLYVQAGLNSIGYFATAWLAQNLARHTAGAERLAAQREIDLASMAQVNQLVIRDMQDGVIVVDEADGIRSLNLRAAALLGRTVPAPGAVRLREIAPALADALARWRAGLAGSTDPVMLARAVGARFVAVGALRSLGAVIFLEDLSRAETQARQLKLAALGRLTANIAHEIRNPLSAISHASELLREEPGIPDSATRLLDIVRDNTRRLDRIVQDVLRLNRRDAAHVERVDVRAYLGEFVTQFAAIEKVDPGVIGLDVAPGLVVRFDRSHLNQVMWNLTRNALRYCSRTSGAVRLLGRRGDGGDGVELLVVDDGPGVVPELRHRLFEPFFTTAASGTGLGLFIAREVCEANGATLEYVESDGGGRFRLFSRETP
jgi:two-component system sensor histidine kinase PilS (NtrC family)